MLNIQIFRGPSQKWRTGAPGFFSSSEHGQDLDVNYLLIWYLQEPPVSHELEAASVCEVF